MSCIFSFISEVQPCRECRISMVLLYNTQSVDFSFLCFIASMLQNSYTHSSRHHFSILTFYAKKKDLGKMRFLSESYGCLLAEMISPQISPIEQGSSCYVILPGTYKFHGYTYYQSEVKLLSRVWLFATPWTVAYKAPPSMGFSRQEYWSGLPFHSPGDLPNPRTESGSPTLQADALWSELPRKPILSRAHTNRKYMEKRSTVIMIGVD